MQHRITPDKDAFLCKLIEISDTDSLQKIVDLISDTQGYINSAHDLVINLLRCNRFETAKKLLEVSFLIYFSQKNLYIYI